MIDHTQMQIISLDLTSVIGILIFQDSFSILKFPTLDCPYDALENEKKPGSSPGFIVHIHL